MSKWDKLKKMSYLKTQSQGSIKNKDTEKTSYCYDEQLVKANSKMIEFQGSVKKLANSMKNEVDAMPDSLELFSIGITISLEAKNN